MPSLGARLSTRACASKPPLSKPLRSARPIPPGHSGDDESYLSGKRGLRPRVAGRKETAAAPNPIPGVPISDKIYSQDPDLSLKETRFGIVYSRRRRRPASLEPVADDSLFGAGMQDGENVDAAARLDLTASVRHFMEKVAGISDDVLCTSMDDPMVLAVLIEACGSKLFPTILVSILRWARRPISRLRSFAAILFSGSLGVVLSLHGIRFLPIQHPRIGALSRTALSGCGLCKIYSVRHFVPLISIDFSALPGYFTRLHVAGALCSLYLPGVLARYFIDVSQYQEEAYSSVPAETGFSGSGTIASAIHAAERSAPNVAEAPKMIVHNWALSPGLPLQKHLKNKRAKSQRTESFSFHTKSLNTYYHIVQLEEYNSSFSPGRLKGKKFVGNKRMKAALADMKQNIESAVCNANILVMASDRCWREEGAKLMLELSDSVEWCIEVKKQETRRYLYKPQYWRPPCHVNLFNHNYMWGWEDDWKLEFFDKWDWLVFKEMHMKCRQRNTLRVLKPIPGVAEVPGYHNTGASCFMRPDKYIHMVGDELERALSSEIASYDMDSEDEEWLKQLTSRSLDSEDKCLGYISADDFEKIIFALDKDVYTTNNKNKDPSKQNNKIKDSTPDKDRAVDLCQGFGKRCIVEAVYDYWVWKRDTRSRNALVRVFQLHMSKKRCRRFRK